MIEIWGKENCAFCNRAKSLCETRQYEYTYKQLDVDFTREQVFETFPNARTFPQIIVGGTKVGGYQEMLSYLEDTGYNGTGYSL
jgi:glutaredoxin